MITFGQEEPRESSNLYAVEPNKLNHNPPDAAHRDKIVRVEFSYAWRNRSLAMFVTISLGLLVWAWFTEIDDVSEAPGQLIPANEVQPVKAVFDGKIVSVSAQEGTIVKAGELLLTLDRGSYANEVSKDNHELSIAQRELERHQHAYEVLQKYLQNPQVVSNDLSSVTTVAEAIGRLYEANKRLKLAEDNMKVIPLDGKTAPQMTALSYQKGSLIDQQHLKESSLQSRLGQFLEEENKLREKIVGLRQQKTLHDQTIEHRLAALHGAQQQLTAYQEVFKIGGSSETECLNARMSVDSKQHDVTESKAQAFQIEGQLQATQQELEQSISNHAMSKSQLQASLKDLDASGVQITSKMRDAERELMTDRTNCRVALRGAQSAEASELSEIHMQTKQVERLQAQLASAEHVLEKCEIRAPVSGLVALMHVQGIGQIVQRGEELMTLVPTSEALMAECYVKNDDVAFVHPGETVKLEFPAYPYQQYGSVNGVIRTIEAFPCDDKAHSSSYKMFVMLDRNWIMCRWQKILLRKGLTTQVQLVLRQRRLLLMQLAPLLKLQYTHFKG